MTSRQVKWIIPDGGDPDRRIDAIGGDNFCDHLDDAIFNIKAGLHRYWTVVNGRAAEVQVARRLSGREYLKTSADSYEPNNLLALPHRRWAA
ncbi:MAG: DUF3892 domain-containing protein [Pseudomonadota bacterium]